MRWNYPLMICRKLKKKQNKYTESGTVHKIDIKTIDWEILMSSQERPRF